MEREQSLPSHHSFGIRKIPTQIKHLILEDYLSAWGGIICGMNPSANLAFVDTCAGAGSYQSDKSQSLVAGSPLIALKTLSQLKAAPRFSGKAIETKSLFIEKDPQNALALRKLLSSGNTFGEQYEVRESEFNLVLDEVLDFTQDSFGFIFVDPFGPSSIPFESVSPIVSQKFNDVLINFPLYSIQKWSGFIDDHDKGGQAKSCIDYVTACFGSTEWIDIHHKYRNTNRLEKEWLNLYLRNLKALGVLATSVPLRYEQKERSIFYLIFTTRNLAGLIAMKDTMYAGKEEETKRRARLQRQTRYPQQHSFFDIDDEWLPATDSDKNNIELLAKEISETLGEGTFTRRHIYEQFIPDTPYLKRHVDKALTALKKQGRAQYNGSLKFDQVIQLK